MYVVGFVNNLGFYMINKETIMFSNNFIVAFHIKIELQEVTHI